MSTWGTTTSATYYYSSSTASPYVTDWVKAEEKMTKILDEMVAGEEKILFNPEDLVL